MSSGYIPASLQRRVRERAGDRCEYCGLAQAHQEATFHVDHVVPRRDGGVPGAPERGPGSTESENRFCQLSRNRPLACSAFCEAGTP